MDPSRSENARSALAGKLFNAFEPEFTAARRQCKGACNRYNNAGVTSRRRQIELWRDITQDETPLPPPLEDPEQDATQLENEPWVESPIRVDYGSNLRLGSNVFINFNCTILDTCLVTIGSRTLLASNVSLYSATHPLDPVLRNGTRGPELGKEIHIGEDCFIGGNVTVCPGVRIGRGATVGAGSVVTKNVPEMCVVAGNPARVIRWLDERALDEKRRDEESMLKKPSATPGNHNETDGETDGKTEAIQGSKTEEQPWAVSESIQSTVQRSEAIIADSGPESNISATTPGEEERLMTQSEWEEEIGRQIAEKALLYGASMK